MIRFREMAKIERFEDLIAWQKARELANRYICAPEWAFAKDFGLRDQIRRAVFQSCLILPRGLKEEADQNSISSL